MTRGFRTFAMMMGRSSGERAAMLRMLMHAWRCTHAASPAGAKSSMDPSTCTGSSAWAWSEGPGTLY